MLARLVFSESAIQVLVCRKMVNRVIKPNPRLGVKMNSPLENRSLVTVPIKLTSILQLMPASDYKVHFARRNSTNHPLDVFVRDFNEWQSWQEYRPAKDDFNRPRIFSLLQVYYESDTWLFGGIWEVVGRHADRYDVKLSEDGKEFIGRLKLRSSYRDRQTRTRLENHLESFEVVEILPQAYSGRKFPGHSNIELSFDELEMITRNSPTDWKGALEHAKGIYLISDTATGKCYVGSAYGEKGIWSRWCEYIDSGHGGNAELRELVSSPSLDYCRANFRFALLEHLSSKEQDDKIIERECFWKKLLLSRTQFGLNLN